MANVQDGRVPRFFQRVGLAVVSLVLFFIVAEVVTRTIDTLFRHAPWFGGDESAVLYVEHPFLERVPRPGARFESYEVNSHGFRGHEFQLPKLIFDSLIQRTGPKPSCLRVLGARPLKSVVPRLGIVHLDRMVF